MSQPLSEQTGQRLLEEFMKMQKDVVLIKAKSDATHARLFGNGQPGVVDKMEAEIQTLKLRAARDDGADSANLKWNVKVSGAVSGLVTLLGFILQWIFRHKS